MNYPIAIMETIPNRYRVIAPSPVIFHFFHIFNRLVQKRVELTIEAIDLNVVGENAGEG